MKIRGTSLVIKFLLTLFVAKFLGFEDLGLYGLISASAIVAPVILGLCLMASISRKAATQPLEETTNSIKHYGLYLTLIYTVLLAATLLIGNIIDDKLLAVLIWLIIFCEHINFDAYGLLLNLSKPMTANILHFIRTGGWALVYMLLAFFYQELRIIEALLIGWMTGSALSLMLLFFITKAWPWNKNNSNTSFKNEIHAEFKQSRTMYANSILETSGTYVSHFIVSFFLGLELTGVYVFFFQIISALSNLIQTGIIQTTQPKLLKASKISVAEYAKIWKKCLKITLVFSSLISLCSIPALYSLLHILNKPLALQWISVFPILLLVFIFSMVYHSNRIYFYGLKKDLVNLRMQIINLSIIIVLEILLIPHFAILGAAISMAIAAFFIAFISYKKVRKEVRF